MKKLLPLLCLLSTPLFASTTPLESLIGQYNEKKEAHFIALDSTVLPVNKKGMYLQKEVTEKLVQAYHDFKKEHPNIPFVVVSATRNYQYQKSIWTNKWNAKSVNIKGAENIAKDILQYSSMPGTSRHHWGTDFDITSVEPSYFQKNPDGIILYQWLQDNMPKYGFCQPYTKGRQGGYALEEWHWSYAPISKQYLKDYKEILQNTPEKITNKLDFIGHNQINLTPLITEYVFDINPACQ